MSYNLIVFDLDFTIWNAGGTWCDQICPPFRKELDEIYDHEIIKNYRHKTSMII